MSRRRRSIRPVNGGLIGLSGQVQFFDSLNGGVLQAIGSPAVLVPTTSDANSAWWGFAETAVLPVFLKDGSHSITAHYLGTSSYSSVISGPTTVVVGPSNAACVTSCHVVDLHTFWDLLLAPSPVNRIGGQPIYLGR